MEFFTYCHGEHPVVFTPDDHGWVGDGAEARGEIGFPGGKVVSHGHDGFDDSGALAITVGPFDDGRREKAGSWTISFRTDSVTSPPNSLLPKETSQDGALDSKACLNDRLVSFAMT